MAEVNLRVTFDIDQVSGVLDWVYLKDDVPVVSDDGKYTGVLVFDRGDTLTLTVTGKSYKHQISSITIIDCQVVNIPFLNSAITDPLRAGQYPRPSPYFDPDSEILIQGATTNLLPTGTVGRMDGDVSTTTWTSPVVLTYVNRGRWETSFVMTVAIEQPSGISYRVFSFDPESDVGPGNKPDPDPPPPASTAWTPGRV